AQDSGGDPLGGRVPDPVAEPSASADAVGPRVDGGRDAGVEVDRQGGRHADERQAQVFGHGPARHLDLVDDEGIDALLADRPRGVPEEHPRLQSDAAKSAPQGGEALELTELLIPRAERAAGEVLPDDLVELQSRRPDRPLEVGDLEVDHFMAPCLEPPPQGGERIVVTRRGETQDADPTLRSSVPLWRSLCRCRPAAPNEVRFVHARLSFVRSSIWDSSNPRPGAPGLALGATTPMHPTREE